MDDHPIERVKPTFDAALARLSGEQQDEVRAMDAFLRSLRPVRFKRSMGKGGRKISYVAPDYGISYGIEVGEDNPTQHFGWYYLYDKEEKRWFLKDDRMEEILKELGVSDKALAERIFAALKECTLCRSPPCGQITYSYGGREKVCCYGRVYPDASREGFADARAFLTRLNERAVNGV